MSAQLDITILFEADIWEEKLPDSRNRIKKVLPFLFEQEAKELPTIEISVVLADDAFVQDLNHRYRGKDKPTNILSFASFESWEQIKQTASYAEELHVGDLVVAYETIAKEAIEQGKTLADHFTHMLLHGALHLLGYDHIEDDEAEFMENKEIKLLAQLGIANPYEER